MDFGPDLARHPHSGVTTPVTSVKRLKACYHGDEERDMSKRPMSEAEREFWLAVLRAIAATTKATDARRR
jgi:hypothetical protein